MLNIAVVDDLREDREHLAEAVAAHMERRTELQPRVQTFDSAEALLSACASETFRLVFLDICMDGMSGIELARALRGRDRSMLIVFVSTSREYAFDAFPIHPFDYLIKPYDDRRLRTLLDEALAALDASVPMVEIRVPYANMTVPVDEIMSVVAQGHAVEICLTDGQHIRSIMTFAELEQQLNGDRHFLLINRGVLINMDQVLTLDDGTVRMKDGATHLLRTRGRSELLAQFTQYQISRLERGTRF